MQTPIIAYDNRMIGCSLNATSTADGFDVFNLKDLRPYTAWKAADATPQGIQIGYWGMEPVNYIAVLGHNFNTVGATVSVECSSDKFATDTTVALPGFVPISDRAFLKLFPSKNKRTWRIKLTGMTAAPQMAILMLGQLLQFPYPPETPYSPFSEGIEGKSAKNKNGHMLGAAIAYNSIEINARFKNLPRSFVFDTFKPVWDSHLKKLKPFFYAWDIDTYPDHVFFVKIKDGHEFQPALTTGSLVDEIDLKMEGVSEF